MPFLKSALYKALLPNQSAPSSHSPPLRSSTAASEFLKSTEVNFMRMRTDDRRFPHYPVLTGLPVVFSNKIDQILCPFKSHLKLRVKLKLELV